MSISYQSDFIFQSDCPSLQMNSFHHLILSFFTPDPPGTTIKFLGVNNYYFVLSKCIYPVFTLVKKAKSYRKLQIKVTNQFNIHIYIWSGVCFSVLAEPRTLILYPC